LTQKTTIFISLISPNYQKINR